MGQYHNRIMNIQSPSHIEECPNETVRVTYKSGHRDARHAAAGIVIEAEREIEELKNLLSCCYGHVPKALQGEIDKYLED